MQLGYEARDSTAALEALRLLANTARGDVRKDATKHLARIDAQKASPRG